MKLQKRQFYGYWRWVFIKVCGYCKAEIKILANDTREKPSLPKGAIICPHCKIYKIPLGEQI